MFVFSSSLKMTKGSTEAKKINLTSEKLSISWSLCRRHPPRRLTKIGHWAPLHWLTKPFGHWALPKWLTTCNHFGEKFGSLGVTLQWTPTSQAYILALDSYIREKGHTPAINKIITIKMRRHGSQWFYTWKINKK